MQILEFAKEGGLVEHFLKVNKQDSQALIGDLRELSANKLQQACQAAGIERAETKADTLTTLANRIATIARESGKKKKETKKVTEAPPQETTAQETPQETAPVESPPAAGLATQSIELKVNDARKRMISRPSPEQREIIKNSIKNSGMHTKIKVQPDMTIITGHTRYEILQELKLPVTIDDIEVVDLTEDQIAEEIFSSDVARRHNSALDKLRWVDKYLPKAKIKEEIKTKKKTDKAADKMVEQAEGKFLSSTKAPAEQKPKKTGAREVIAKKANVSPYDVKRKEWCEKYVPNLLKTAEEQAKADGTGTEGLLKSVYEQGQEFWKAVKKWAPEAFEQVRAGKLDLIEANKTAMENAIAASKKKAKEIEHKAGPLEKLCLEVKSIHWKTLEKKYAGKDGWAPDEFEADFINRMDVLTEKHHKKNT